MVDYFQASELPFRAAPAEASELSGNGGAALNLTRVNPGEYLHLPPLPVWPFVLLSAWILVLRSSYSIRISTCLRSSPSRWLCW